MTENTISSLCENNKKRRSIFLRNPTFVSEHKSDGKRIIHLPTIIKTAVGAHISCLSLFSYKSANPPAEKSTCGFAFIKTIGVR